MKQEVVSAVDFLTGILKKRNISQNQVEAFQTSLENILVSHYENHWFPDKPYKGSAYRCMRIVDGKMDALMAQAGTKSGVSETQLLNTLPRELTMWVDPDEVSYRIGEDGSVGVIFDRQSGNHVETGDVEIPSRNSSPASVTSRTPSPVSSSVYWHEQLQQKHNAQLQQQQLQQQQQQQQLQQQQQQFRLQLQQQQQQQQQHYQQRRSQDFFPGFLQQQQQKQQQQHSPNHPQHYEPEATCRDTSRWLPGVSRTRSPPSWEYLATYAAS